MAHRKPKAMTYTKGDRVQDTKWGVVGTVDRCYTVGDVDAVDVIWDPASYRIDDPAIKPFDEKAEQDRIVAALEARSGTKRG